MFKAIDMNEPSTLEHLYILCWDIQVEYTSSCDSVFLQQI